MNAKLQKTMIAGAVMALMSSPVWTASDGSGSPAETPQAQTGQPMDAAPQPMDAAPQVDTAPQLDPAPQMDAGSGPAFSDNPLYSSTPDELRRAEVVDVAGDKVGRIKTIVLGPEGESAHAVISVGGILGLGAREIIVSLDELELVEDKLHVGATREELEARGDYEPEQYVELEPETPIREFSAFEPTRDEGGPPAGMPQAPQERQ